jgi:hypothetical protein
MNAFVALLSQSVLCSAIETCQRLRIQQIFKKTHERLYSHNPTLKLKTMSDLEGTYNAARDINSVTVHEHFVLIGLAQWSFYHCLFQTLGADLLPCIEATLPALVTAHARYEPAAPMSIFITSTLLCPSVAVMFAHDLKSGPCFGSPTHHL